MNPPPGIEEYKGLWLVERDTHLGKWVKEHGSLNIDPYLFRWLQERIDGVDTIWDVGANVGDHTNFYLSLGATVIAIEPHPVAFVCLEHNCPAARCLNVAASDAAGSLNFAALDNVGASRVSPGGEWSVEAVRLDDLGLPAPGFVKIDVEGHEVHALRGMYETLKKFRPVVFCEVNRAALAGNGQTPDDIKAIFESLGYSSYTLYPQGVSWESEQFDILATP